MKALHFLTLTVAAALVSGCASGKNGLVLNTVGPSPAQPMGADSTNGTLLVYTAYTRNADFAGRDSRRPEYSDYKIASADGNLVLRVHNNAGTILQDPKSVELAPGKYNVFARVNGYGHLTIPVMIVGRQTTVLHLEGGDSWPNASAFNQANSVRLPDDQIIGWKAASDL